MKEATKKKLSVYSKPLKTVRVQNWHKSWILFLLINFQKLRGPWNFNCHTAWKIHLDTGTVFQSFGTKLMSK